MKRQCNPKHKPGFHELSFAELVKQDEQLAELRRSFAGSSAQERREAADWAYNAGLASGLFTQALEQIGQASAFSQKWPPGIDALAIDPTFAPALLTVGSMEHQLGRSEEAMGLFFAMLKLPADTDELEIIIDKAGTCLLEQNDSDGACELYEAACRAFPKSTQLLGGLGYSLSKLGQHKKSVHIHRRAVALKPNNYDLLSDLGWALTESGQYDEARKVLQRAIELAPPDDDRAQNNLEEVRRREKATRH